jgi:spermidine/putrescine transport system substrate-binding protein
MQVFVAILLAMLIVGCQPIPAPGAATPISQPLPKEIVLYNWVSDLPETAIEAFTKEYGVQVRYETYESQEEAIENIKAGNSYDVVVLDNRYIPGLIANGKLLEFNHANIPNLNNISADFRDRSFDRGNHYSVPYNWGTTGLVVRSDLAKGPVTSWTDLWKQDGAGKVVLWKGLPREMLGAALKSLGFSANSENEQELELALQQLEKLRPNLIFAEDFGPDLETSSPILTLGNAVMAVGWSYDAIEGQKDVQAISYVLPQEGALLWGDNFVIPANSANQYAAELFINFILRPEISALITNENSYATGNEKANQYITANILKNPYIFPPIEVVRNAETILPLSPAGEALHAAIWKRFIGEP